LKESRHINKIDEECKETEERRIFEKGRERRASKASETSIIREKNKERETRGTSIRKETEKENNPTQ
jgi:hypothetical protein